MNEIILYGSELCIETPPIIERLDEANIEYKLVDITSGMSELREFLKLRDEEPFFDKVKENHYVGIPTLMVDGKLYNPYEVEDFNIFK